MKQTILCSALLTLPHAASAQQRYMQEVFTDAQIGMVADERFGVNLDFMHSVPACASFLDEVDLLQQLTNNGADYPSAFFDTADASTCAKLATLRMDVYAPLAAFDPCTDRPMVIVLHDGMWLPPPLNARPYGTRKDSSTVEWCRRLARRGYVAAAIDVRLGWNPLAWTMDDLRWHFYNAFYRTVHDAREAMRWLKASADAGNPFGVDPERIAVLGAGYGAFTALGAGYWDRLDEVLSGQLLQTPGSPSTSFINPALAGDPQGEGGLLNLYRPNGASTEVRCVAALGGMLPDSLWIEPGDAPLVAFHCVHDPLYPFDNGPVIAFGPPTFFMQAHGSQALVRRANSTAINAGFAAMPSDPFTDRARALYGTSVGGEAIAPASQSEGLFPVIRPTAPGQFAENSPWHWWDPQHPFALHEIAPGITTHDAALQFNPDVSAEKGRRYADTLFGYLSPRLFMSMDLLAACGVVRVNDSHASTDVAVHPIPANEQWHVRAIGQRIGAIELLDITGRELRRIGSAREQVTMHRHGLPAGSYLLRISMEGGAVIRPIVLE